VCEEDFIHLYSPLFSSALSLKR